MKRLMVVALLLLALGGVAAGCGTDTDADVASENLSKAAEQFEVDRKIVAFNGITDNVLIEVEGACDIEQEYKQLEITCKDNEEKFKKHFVGLSDNVSYFAEQINPIGVSTSHYRVIIKPEALVPDFDRP
jgi:hypothetical protein